jgi:FlaA1/EpsC-like NDP-sugar epimerase
VTTLALSGRAGRLNPVYSTLSKHHRISSTLVYSVEIAAAYGFSYLLRFEFAVPGDYAPIFAITLPLLILCRLVANYFTRVSTGRWRFISTPDVLRLAASASIGSILFVFLTTILEITPPVPRSIVFFEYFLTTYLVAGTWISYRVAYEWLRLQRSQPAHRAKAVLIIGAGEAGNLLVREMCRVPTGYRPIGFVDDDPLKVGNYLHGIPVLGQTENLQRIAAEQRPNELIIAVPSAAVETLRRIVDMCEKTGIPFKVLPGISDVLRGNVRTSFLREVRIEDLLGRPPITLELPELAEDLRGKSVLITGAAGSIGSELSRQILMHRPATLVLLDQAETDLYYLDLELREQAGETHLVSMIGDIIDAETVQLTFSRFKPDRVFHAAAYKHVPLMESNPVEALRNNVLGTWRVAEQAGKAQCERFILVSTDKAVRPKSIMGASKRLAEMVILESQRLFPKTCYGAVRFGNVLGSQGSVIPTFERQIAAGKPLTVTHPDATRYFMTIPEAVQLILQASLLKELSGNIAMLEMGDPIRIVDLAHNLIRLSGARYEEGSGIVFTGLRPGEKLHEELSTPDELALPTRIDRVQVLSSAAARADMLPYLMAWENTVGGRKDEALCRAVLELFPALRDQEELLARAGAWQVRQTVVA